MKEPDEPIFTLTAMDKHGVEYNGRVRRLMPKECFRLQGYTDKQFEKLVKIGIPEAQLYKMAGNSVTTNVVTAIGFKLKQEIRKLEKEDKKANNIFYRIAEIAKRLCSG
jgi:DNA (cytosine-5)-methyltransferase 1